MNLPEPQIDRNSAMRLWIKERSEYAKEQMVLNNVGMVGLVLKSLHMNPVDEDLFATGLVGVIKSVNTFNPQKEIQFSSYASAVIRNEIIMSLRKKRSLDYCSIDEPLVSENGDNLYFYDVIEDKKCMEDEVVAKTHIENVFRTLKERDRKVIELLISGKEQQEVAQMFGITQSMVSKIVSKVKTEVRN